MRLRAIAVALATAFLLPSAMRAQRAGERVTAWTSGHWFNGMAFVAMDVYSTGSRLALKRPRRIDRTVDLAGAYVTPPFGEAHNHNIPSTDTAATIRDYLEQGIYHVMIHANVPGAREKLQGQINHRESIDVAFANGAFTAPGGHPSALVERNIRNGIMTAADRNGGFIHPVASTDDIDRQWSTTIRAQRPDFLKMILVYSEDRTAGVPRPAGDRHGLEPALAAHIVRLAHRERLRVSAHVESAFDFDVAVNAGADVIAHLPGFWPDADRVAQKSVDIYRITEDSARRAGRQRTTVVTTIGEALQFLMTEPGLRMREPMLGIYRHNLEILSKHGVRIAIGSDLYRGTSLGEAIEIYKAGVMPTAQLLRALSLDTAATIFPNRAPFGLAEGAPADFLVLDGNPLADFTATQRIRSRVKEGELLVMAPGASRDADRPRP